MQPESHPISQYTKIVAIIIMIGLVPALAFYIGTQYQSTVQVVTENEVPPSLADFSEYEFPVSENKTFSNTDLGIIFEYNDNEWVVSTSSPEEIILTGINLYKDDRVIFTKRMGPSFTIMDAKFGPTTFSYAETNNLWLVDKSESSLTTSEDPQPVMAEPTFYTDSNLPVYSSTGRWKTVVVELSSETMISVNITGSGSTEPLDPIVKSIKKLP